MQAPSVLNSPFHKPSEDDVIAVRLFLLAHSDFPLELVDIIIDFAEYWACLHANTNQAVSASASRIGDNHYEATWLYLVSPPVPKTSDDDANSGRRPRRMQKVQFETLSHDQGWSTDEGVATNRGTYNGSFTWFEAMILCADQSPPDRWLDRATSKPLNLNSRSSVDRSTAELFPIPYHGPDRWHVQSNLMATDETHRHVVSWTRDEDIEAHCDAKYFKGRDGLGHELVKKLQPGDRVMLLAKAMKGAWVNHVSSASIEIYYSV